MFKGRATDLLSMLNCLHIFCRRSHGQKATTFFRTLLQNSSQRFGTFVRPDKIKWLFLNRKGITEVPYLAEQKSQCKNATCLSAIWLYCCDLNLLCARDSPRIARFINVWSSISKCTGGKTAFCSAEIIRGRYISKSFRYVSYPSRMALGWIDRRWSPRRRATYPEVIKLHTYPTVELYRKSRIELIFRNTMIIFLEHVYVPILFCVPHSRHCR